MAHIKGCLTNKRYKIATKYVEHHSDMSYVHLQTDIIEDEFQIIKITLKNYAMDQVILIKHYHSDNCRFAENDIKEQ